MCGHRKQGQARGHRGQWLPDGRAAAGVTGEGDERSRKEEHGDVTWGGGDTANGTVTAPSVPAGGWTHCGDRFWARQC